ncbi:MAG: D-aminoacylase, partial [Pyramidobacter sp.]|nr:D-aminoacylase [Pyramidobacter sp.]
YAADIAVFDPETVADKATYTDPTQYSAGIPYVIVNGRLVVDGGQIAKGKAGKVLRFKKE